MDTSCLLLYKIWRALILPNFVSMRFLSNLYKLVITFWLDCIKTANINNLKCSIDKNRHLIILFPSFTNNRPLKPRPFFISNLY